MATRVDRLITNVIRKISNNEEFSSDTGIDDELVLYYINEGQHRLQANIIAAHNNLFIKTTTQVTAIDTATYALPSDAYLENKVISVDYSDDNGANYERIKLVNDEDRSMGSDNTGRPHGYSVEEGVIHLSPVPNEIGQLRIRYTRRIDELDKRRGVASIITLDNSTNTITALTLDVSGDPPIDQENLDGDHDFMCVVDTLGTMKMRNIQIDSIDTSTGAVTVNAGFTYESGETIAVGDYVVGGKDTSTHIELGRSVERYLVRYTVLTILQQDSSVDISEADTLLRRMEEEIVRSYASVNEGEFRESPLHAWWID